MEVALTFGSVGDIIQLCQIAIQLGRAIGVGCAAAGTSAKEYQELRDELDIFVHILVQVVAAFQQRETSPYLKGLDDVSRSVVDQCACLIQDTLDHLQSRYQNSLHIGGSGKRARDVYKRLEWSLREKERLQTLRGKLKEGIQRLSLLTTLAVEKSARVDNTTLLSRIDEVQHMISSKCFSAQEEVLSLLRKGREEEQVGWQIVTLAKAAISSILEVKDLLIQVSDNVVQLQLLASNTMFLRTLDPTKELPVILEDALGRKLPIPSQWVDSIEWEVLHGLLSGHFKGTKGHEMVLRRKFVLEENSSGKDLNKNRPLHACLRRGMKINMSMIFETAEMIEGACPRCHTTTDAVEDVTIQCLNPDCSMWFRVQRLILSDTITQQTHEFTHQPKAAVTSIPVEPGDFQRVRLIRSEAPIYRSHNIRRAADDYGLAFNYNIDDPEQPRLPLTAATLRKANKQLAAASKSSTRRSSMDDTVLLGRHSEDFTIRVSGAAVVKIGNVELKCEDGEVAFSNNRGTGKQAM